MLNNLRFQAVNSNQAGISLLEVLVSLVLISIGLLGISAAQLTSLKQTTSAYQRAQVSLLADDIADRMRANPVEAKKSASAYLTTQLNAGDQGTVCVNYNAATTGTCTSANMAEQDVFDWQQAIINTLNGQGFICRDSTPEDGTSPTSANCDNALSSPFVIKIWWDDGRTGNANDFLRFTTSVEI